MSDPHAALRQAANAAAARGDWAAAAGAFAAIAARDPGDASAWTGVAKAQGLAGDVRAMHAAALRAAAAGPRGWAHGLALARILRELHETRPLSRLATALLAHAGDADLDGIAELADLLGREDAHAQALRWLDIAAARAPDHAPAFYLRGSTHLFMGDMDAARADLERAIALSPHFAHAHWRLSELRRHDPAGAGARIDRLRAERARVAAGSEHDIHFSYALFSELHETGEHAAAWAALERGRIAKRAALRYDDAADRALFDALRRRCDAAFVAGPGHAGGGEEPAPVFVIGLFRSGTTLLERVLGGHPEVAEGGETLGFAACLQRAANLRRRRMPDLDVLAAALAIDWPALGAAFMAQGAWRAGGRARWTEKLPSNFLNAGMVARALPRARFIHMHRAPMDVCFSNLRQLYGSIAPYSYDQREMAAYHGRYAALMAHWRGVLGERLLDLAHADLVADPDAAARRVFAHVGLAHAPGATDIAGRGGAVSTASAAQVREGIRRPSAPDWLPYEAQLAPLREALG